MAYRVRDVALASKLGHCDFRPQLARDVFRHLLVPVDRPVPRDLAVLFRHALQNFLRDVAANAGVNLAQEQVVVVRDVRVVRVALDLVPQPGLPENVLAPFPKLKVCLPRVRVPKVRVLVRGRVRVHQVGVEVDFPSVGEAVNFAVFVRHELDAPVHADVLLVEHDVVPVVHSHSDKPRVLQEFARLLLAAAENLFGERVEVDLPSAVVPRHPPSRPEPFERGVDFFRAFEADRVFIGKVVPAVVVGNVDRIDERLFPFVFDKPVFEQG